MKSSRTSYEDTMRGFRANMGRKYPSNTDKRAVDGVVFPTLNPSFCIPTDGTVFTIGSCFARNIEEALLKIGVNVPSAQYQVPPTEASGRSNAILNQYNAGTMYEIVNMTLNEGEIRGGLYEISDGLYGDALLATAVKHPVPMSRIEERRKEIVNLYKNGIHQCDTIIVTLGLVECWFDLEDQIYLNNFPTSRIANAAPTRFEFRRLGVEASLNFISKMLELMCGDSNRKVVLTVSPVPIGSTFSELDCVAANGYSKSVLRVVAEELSHRFSFVDYFPSYEIVTSSGFQNYMDDQIHVKPQIVHRIVDYMLDNYTSRTR